MSTDSPTYLYTFVDTKCGGSILRSVMVVQFANLSQFAFLAVPDRHILGLSGI